MNEKEHLILWGSLFGIFGILFIFVVLKFWLG